MCIYREIIWYLYRYTIITCITIYMYIYILCAFRCLCTWVHAHNMSQALAHESLGLITEWVRARISRPCGGSAPRPLLPCSPSSHKWTKYVLLFDIGRWFWYGDLSKRKRVDHIRLSIVNGASTRRPILNDINDLSVKLFMLNSGLCLHRFASVFNGIVELASKV